MRTSDASMRPAGSAQSVVLNYSCFVVLGLNWPRELGFCFLPGHVFRTIRPGREVATSPLGLEAKSLKNGKTQ